MATLDLSMPVAVPPVGSDPIPFYGTFVGKLVASWSPTDGLVMWLAASDNINRLHAPIKAALRFIPHSSAEGSASIDTDTLALQTWPTTYVTAKDVLGASVPSEIRIENVDAGAVRAAVQPLFVAIGRTEEAVDAFMDGNGLLMVTAGTLIGGAAPAAEAPSLETPNRVEIRLFDGSGTDLNPVQFFSEAATFVDIDTTAHPLLSQLDLDGWVEIVAMDASGTPLIGTPYTLYLSDGTSRTGSTDGNGRIYETEIPAGGWSINLENYASFAILD